VFQESGDAMSHWNQGIGRVCVDVIHNVAFFLVFFLKIIFFHVIFC
jgi:hypothetical protein